MVSFNIIIDDLLMTFDNPPTTPTLPMADGEGYAGQRSLSRSPSLCLSVSLFPSLPTIGE